MSMDILVIDESDIVLAEPVDMPELIVVRELTDEAVHCSIFNIVNSDKSLEEKEDQLDELYFQVCNHHERGMAADIIETIFDEQNHLRHPSWAGRLGTFISVQRLT